MVKKLGRQAEADIIELKQPDGHSVFIKPSANLLKDSKGHKVGYVEVARVVTDLVHAEREMNVKLERIRQVNEATREAAVHLSSTSSDLAREFSGVQQALDNQQNRLQETVTAMEQMNVTVQQVAQSATEAAEQSQSAREQAQQGAAIVDQSVNAILRVSEQASAMKVSMHQLGKQAQEIGAVLGVISDIADQTNLLALNAAIEAARAGEAGRGFAVVADEVRKLAEKTMQATSEVEKAIGSIQRGAQDSIRMVEETGGLVENASTLATRSGEALQSIVHLVTASSDQVRNIATAAEEQSATSDHINSAIDEVANMASDVSSRMDASTGSVQELAALARELDKLSKG
jgi:methyl-accepting chemotaxis protein